MKKIILFLTLLLIAVSCKGQEKETYWKSHEVGKENKGSIYGVTLAYMEMIIKMKIHATRNNDDLVFDYPYERKVKISDLKSLTGCRLKSTGELLDSVYDIRIEGDKMKIKFHYIGTDSKDNQFYLTLIKTDKNTYSQEIEKLQADKKRLLSMIEPVDVSGLNLSVSIPEYCKPEIKLGVLSPIELAEDLCEIRGLETVSVPISFTISGKGKFAYYQYGILNADKINRSVAKMDKLDFTGLQMLTDGEGKRVEAWMVSKESTDKKEIQSILKTILSKYPNAKITSTGEPLIADSKESIHSVTSKFGIILRTDRDVVKLMIKIPEQLYDNGRKSKALSYKASSKEFLKEFEHYIDCVEKGEIRIVVSSKKLDDELNSDGISGTVPSFVRESSYW